MQQLFMSLSLLIILIGCSKSGGDGKVENPIIQEASISAVVGQADPIVLDLGNIAYGKSADGMISIKQSLVASLIPSGLVGGKLVVSGSDELLIISQSGCTSIKKSTGTCSIKVRANTQGLEEGNTISGQIFFHLDENTQEETFIQISATVGNAPVVETPALVSSSSSAAFGSLSISDSSKDIILTYKALSLISSSDSHEVVVPSPFVIQAASADRCSNKTISKGASCTVKVRLDPKLISTNGLVSGNITFAGLSIPVSATISGNPDEEVPSVSQLVWLYNNQEISVLDLGTLLSSNVPAKFNLFLKNKASSPEEVNVSFSGTGFTIINRCIDKILAPQAQCSLEVRPEQSVGNKSVAISVEDQPSLALPLAMNVINQVITYQTVDTTAACSSLNLQICGGTQNISKSYVCEQYIDGVKNSSYVSNQSDCSPLADMSAIICQSPAGQITNPISNGNQSFSCVIGSTAQTPIPDSIVCNSGFTLSNNSCLAIDPSGTIAFANAYSNVLEGNVLNITSEYASQLQLYSNSSCSILSGSPVALPASSTLISLPSGNGSKIIYAKFLNGSLSSSCLSASIMLDQALPSLAFSAPSVGAIVTSQVVISGTCSDTGNSLLKNPLEISIVGVAGSTQTVECSSTSSGTFSLNYILPSGILTQGQNYNFEIKALDNANNERKLTRQFSYPVQHLLSVTSNQSGSTITSSPAGISCGSTCSSSYPVSYVTLTQTAPAGYIFTGWSGGGCSGTSSCQVYMNAAQNVSATYAQAASITLTKAGVGIGNVNSNPSGLSCNTACTSLTGEFGIGQTVTLSASAGLNSVFGGWSGAGCSGTGTCVVSLSSSVNVTATFNGVPCVAADAPAAGVDLTNSTGISGFKPNCTIAGCNSGYSVIEGQRCGINNGSTATTTGYSGYQKMEAVGAKLFAIGYPRSGFNYVLLDINVSTGAGTIVPLETNESVYDITSVEGQLLVLTKNGSTNVWKLKKYSAGSLVQMAQLAALSTSNGFYNFAYYQNQNAGTIMSTPPQRTSELVTDSRRVYLKRFNEPAQNIGNKPIGQELIYYEVANITNIIAGGTFGSIRNVSNYNNISVLGKTNSCLYYLDSTDLSISTLLRSPLAGISSNCTAISITSTNTQGIKKMLIGDDHFVFTMNEDPSGLVDQNASGSGTISVRNIMDNGTTMTTYSLFGRLGFKIGANKYLSRNADGYSYDDSLLKVTNSSTLGGTSYSDEFCKIIYVGGSSLSHTERNSNNFAVSGKTLITAPSKSCSLNGMSPGVTKLGIGNLLLVDSVANTVNFVHPLYTGNYIAQYDTMNSFVYNSKFYYTARKVVSFWNVSGTSSNNYYLYSYDSATNTSKLVSSTPIPVSGSEISYGSIARFETGYDRTVVVGNILIIYKTYIQNALQDASFTKIPLN